MWSKDSCASVDNICEDEEEGVVNCLKKENYEIFVNICEIFVKMSSRKRVS